MHLTAEKEWFKDSEGRSVLLRGVNLGGSSKVPAPDGATHIKTDFSNHEDVSFVGRPFRLEEADEHYTRLQSWGFNCLWFLVTWEAIEHAGPGVYDRGYLDYLEAVVEKAGEYGFFVFIDPHQDVWSRMTGGDGAPGWLFEKVGLDFTTFDATEAAIVMQHRYPDYEPMCWPQNYNRFSAATMFTLFFGGNDFAPHCLIDGRPVQEYLQTHYINAITQVADRLKGLPHVIGYECMNEPHPGFIGVNDLTVPTRVADQIMPGLQIPPFDGMVSASGVPRTVKVAELKRLGVKITGETVINPGKVSCWLRDRDAIWQKEGIWEMGPEDNPRLLRPDHFGIVNGSPVLFFTDYLTPFINRYATEIRNIHPNVFIFVEGEPYHPETMKWELNDAGNVVNASHWYDGVTLITKKFSALYNYDITTGSLVFTHRGIKNMFTRQLRRMKEASTRMQNIPTVIGEFGIPFDMNNRRAYKTGDFSSQVTALAMNYDVLDSLLLHSTLWNYTADNTNQWGDQWNLEDLSIFSRDQKKTSDISSGGRALKGFCRPYAQKTAGTPLRMSFDLKKGRFLFEFDTDPTVDEPTEIFVPRVQYPGGATVAVTNGQFQKKDDHVFIFADTPGRCIVEISRV
ncbi:MAG: cellulase family glycosylhydrolase [Theionarchaea archaeon]|nr:cellulase family glycosylhydrolase [Theionarchaea archaeon]MBU7037430.1 cellulase family glycosylhydrolase [Theionarchaea archaeon]